MQNINMEKGCSEDFPVPASVDEFNVTRAKTVLAGPVAIRGSP
jgi:hypothetical protein